MDVLRVLGSFCGICHIYNRKNSRYSICTKQISEAVQFIKANYWYKVLQVISTRSDIDHQLCYESGCCLHGCTKASQCSQSMGGPTRWHCPAQLRTPLCYQWSPKYIDYRLICWREFLPPELYIDKRSAAGDKVASSHSRAGLLGSVCVSCFVIPANWPSLHPTLPYQGMARGGNRP